MTSIASHQQSSNMQRHFTIKDLESDKRRLQGTITQMSEDFNYRITEMGNELDRADKLLQRVIEWSEWQGSGCPRFNDIKDDIKAFLEEAHHD